MHVFSLFFSQIYDQSGETIVAQLCKQTKGSSKEFFGQANSFTVKCKYQIVLFKMMKSLYNIITLSFGHIERMFQTYLLYYSV